MIRSKQAHERSQHDKVKQHRIHAQFCDEQPLWNIPNNRRSDRRQRNDQAVVRAGGRKVGALHTMKVVPKVFRMTSQFPDSTSVGHVLNDWSLHSSGFSHVESIMRCAGIHLRGRAVHLNRPSVQRSHQRRVHDQDGGGRCDRHWECTHHSVVCGWPAGESVSWD